jgi:hypothetical protein
MEHAPGTAIAVYLQPRRRHQLCDEVAPTVQGTTAHTARTAHTAHTPTAPHKWGARRGRSVVMASPPESALGAASNLGSNKRQVDGSELGVCQAQLLPVLHRARKRAGEDMGRSHHGHA